MRATAIAMALLCPLLACADEPQPTKPEKSSRETGATDPGVAAPANPTPDAAPAPAGVRVEIGNPGPACVRTLCIGGPGQLDDDPNRDLGELCRRAPGVVRRCEGERCHSVWALDDWRAGLDALLTSLDQTGDGRITGEDPACTLQLAGWSRGGAVVSEELPAALAADERLAGDPSRAKIARLVAVAPWAPERDALNIAANVETAWIYRHSKAPEQDCSRAWEGGPWLSPKPVCGPTTKCYDYDYSHEPLLAFVGRRGARSGAEIGHCMIAAITTGVGLENLAHGREAYTEHLPHYSDGSLGGRKHEEGPPPPWAAASDDSAPPE